MLVSKFAKVDNVLQSLFIIGITITAMVEETWLFGLIGLAIIGIWQVISFLVRIYWILQKDSSDKRLYSIYVLLAAIITPLGFVIISKIDPRAFDELYPIFLTIPIAIYFNWINWKVDMKYAESLKTPVETNDILNN